MKLEAATRLRAWQVNPIGKDGLWRDYMKRGQLDIEDVRKHGRKVGELHGFDVWAGDIMHPSVSDGAYALVDASKDQIALSFTYYETMTKSVIVENVIMVNPSYQGKGLAFAFYEWLLSKHTALKSDTSFSSGAAKMWMKLIQKHNGYIELVLKGRHIKVDIQGFSEFKGTFWPVAYSGGQLVNLGERRARATGAEKKAIDDFRYVVTR
jgi:GNAT superfamily N-acetyltransferase